MTFSPAPIPPPQPSRSALWIAIAALAVIVLAGGGIGAYVLVTKMDRIVADEDDDSGRRIRRDKSTKKSKSKAKAKAATAEETLKEHGKAVVSVDARDPSLGAVDAPVTIVVFSDFQCPFCSRVESTLTALRERYGPKKLRMVWKDFPLPFHKKALPAHQAAQAVFELGGSKAFWKFHALAFANHRDLDPEKMELWATESGVKGDAFRTKLASLGQTEIERDMALGKLIGVRGTPAFFINGVFLSGAQSEEKFAAIVDEQLAAAQKQIAGGTPKHLVYVTLTNANHAAKPTAQPKKAADDGSTVFHVPVSLADPQLGPRDALVTIVTFSDFQCPFCKKLVPTITALRQHYGQQVRFVWKDNPLSFHKQARPAAMLAHEAFAQRGRDGFWRAHDHLFENQRNLEDNDLLRYAGQLGLDVAAAQLAVSSQKHQRIVRKSQRLASRLGATGAPTSFVNGRLLKGARPVDAFKKLIDEELRKAKTLVADGTRKSELYAKIIRDGTRRERLDRRFVAGVSDAPFLGAENAPVVIHEFSDFQCPFCSRVNPTLKTVLAEYGNRVKLVWRHKPLPFHKNAPLAHQAALEAFAQKGNDGFWTMHDKLFENQRALQRLDLEGYALSTGLDITRFRAALDDGRHQARIDRDLAAADAANIKGTPSFVINGEFISGAQPIAKFRTVIDRALAAAQ